MPTPENSTLKDALAYVSNLTDAAAGIQKFDYFPDGDDNQGTELPYALVPEGYKVQALADLIFHPHRERPSRIEQDQTFATAASFIAYINRFKQPGSIVTANIEGLKFGAVLDYHDAPDQPRWCRHRAALTLKLSSAAETWLCNNRKAMTQVEFAEFIEDNAGDMEDAAGMVEVARNITATKSATFKTATNLSNGSVAFNWTEETSGHIENGRVSIPQMFTINIPVFRGEPSVQIPVRFRYRIDEGKLRLLYVINRPEVLTQKTALTVFETIKAQTGIEPYVIG